MIKERIPQIDELTQDEKRLLVQELQADIGEDSDQDDEFQQFPIQPWQVELLEERVREADANPGAGSSWEEVEARLLAKLRAKGSGNP